MENKYEVIGSVIGKVIGKIASLFLTTWLVMLLWNYNMVETFNLPAISYWMALGMRLLCYWLVNIGFTISFFEKD